MQIIAIRSPLLKKGNDAAAIIAAQEILQPRDILVISSKAVATVQGNEIQLSTLKVSAEAKKISEESGRDAHYVQAVLNETARMNGRVVSTAAGGILTELHPAGFPEGRLLVPGAGLDQSNIKEGYAIGWPRDPVMSVRKLRHALGCAVILSDSCCTPRRLGVTAFALACAGIDPFLSMIGKPDAFGTILKITQEAVADQLATAANIVMGNAAQLIPAAIIRDHGFTLSDYEGWVPGIEQERDLFQGIMK